MASGAAHTRQRNGSHRPSSPADDAAYGTTLDQHFAYYLTHDDDAPNFMIYNFDVLKAQGLRACNQQSSGMSTHDAIRDLESLVGYPDDVAANIVISATVLYCNWVNPP